MGLPKRTLDSSDTISGRDWKQRKRAKTASHSTENGSRKSLVPMAEQSRLYDVRNKGTPTISAPNDGLLDDRVREADSSTGGTPRNGTQNSSFQSNDNGKGHVVYIPGNCRKSPEASYDEVRENASSTYSSNTSMVHSTKFSDRRTGAKLPTPPTSPLLSPLCERRFVGDDSSSEPGPASQPQSPEDFKNRVFAEEDADLGDKLDNHVPTVRKISTVPDLTLDANIENFLELESLSERLDLISGVDSVFKPGSVLKPNSLTDFDTVPGFVPATRFDSFTKFGSLLDFGFIPKINSVPKLGTVSLPERDLKPVRRTLPFEVWSLIFECIFTNDKMSIYPSDYVPDSRYEPSPKYPEKTFSATLTTIGALLATSRSLRAEALKQIRQTPLHVYISDSEAWDDRLWMNLFDLVHRLKSPLLRVTDEVNCRRIDEQGDTNSWRIFGELVIHFAPHLAPRVYDDGWAAADFHFWSSSTKRRQSFNAYDMPRQRSVLLQGVALWEDIMERTYRGGMDAAAWFRCLRPLTKSGSCEIRMIFHEADGRIAERHEVTSAEHDRPTLPCWQYGRVLGILRCWNWINERADLEPRKRLDHGRKRNRLVELPNITIAVNREAHRRRVTEANLSEVQLKNEILSNFNGFAHQRWLDPDVQHANDMDPGPGNRGWFHWLALEDWKARDKDIFFLMEGLGHCDELLRMSEIVSPWDLLNWDAYLTSSTWSPKDRDQIEHLLAELRDDLRTDRVFYGDSKILEARAAQFQKAVELEDCSTQSDSGLTLYPH